MTSLLLFAMSAVLLGALVGGVPPNAKRESPPPDIETKAVAAGREAPEIDLPQSDGALRLAAFRVDAARAGDYPEAAALAAELQATSADFRRLWAEHEVRSHGVGLKRLEHPLVGPLTLEYSAFSVDSGDGLSMIVYTPASPADAGAIALLLSDRSRTAHRIKLSGESMRSKPQKS